ncbi:MAG: hypothetical protein MUC96_04000 [Myxococcaceae bacterium]|jgi:hypothetical protein|nr:hypothetical protein [Myxococcaceae bacterium]
MDAGRREAPGPLALDVKARALAPGDAVRGRVTLHLEAPTQALRLVVGLEARRRSVQGGGAVPLRYRQDVIWRTERALDGERAFTDGQTWPFELLVPDDALAPGFGPRTSSRFPLVWRVVARLERPWTFSLKVEVPVQVTARAPVRPAGRRARTRRGSDGPR